MRNLLVFMLAWSLITDAEAGSQAQALAQVKDGWGDLKWGSAYTGSDHPGRFGTYYCTGKAPYPTAKVVGCPGAPESVWGHRVIESKLSYSDGKLESVTIRFDGNQCAALKRLFGPPRDEKSTTNKEGISQTSATWEDPDGVHVYAICTGDSHGWGTTVWVKHFEPAPPDDGKRFSEGETRHLSMSNATMRGTLDGIAYSYTSDGGMVASRIGADPAQLSSFRAENWEIACNSDPMDDSKVCHISRQADGIPIALFVAYAGGGVGVCVGVDHYPNKPVQIRVDDKPAHTTDRSKCFWDAEAAKIVEEITTGKNVVTRYMEWPYETWRTAKFETTGFATSFALMKWLYANK